MSSDLLLTLQITAVGMGLVFSAIILLWGLMSLLVRVTTSRVKAQISQEEDFDKKKRAAAVAVAIELSKLNNMGQLHEFPLPATALVSAWQAVMRTSMLTKRGPRR